MYIEISAQAHLPSALSHSPAHMGTKKKKPFRGPLTDSYSRPRSKRQKQLVEAGQCRECGNPLGRAVTICDKCADKAAAVAAAAYAADKAAAQKEAEKNSPLLEPSELQALPQLATGKDAIKEVKERGNVSGAGGGGGRPGQATAAALAASVPHSDSDSGDAEVDLARLRGRGGPRAVGCEIYRQLSNICKLDKASKLGKASKQAAQARLERRAAHRAHQGAAHLQQQQPPPSRAGGGGAAGVRPHPQPAGQRQSALLAASALVQELQRQAVRGPRVAGGGHQGVLRCAQEGASRLLQPIVQTPTLTQL